MYLTLHSWPLFFGASVYPETLLNYTVPSIPRHWQDKEWNESTTKKRKKKFDFSRQWPLTIDGVDGWNLDLITNGYRAQNVVGWQQDEGRKQIWAIMSTDKLAGPLALDRNSSPSIGSLWKILLRNSICGNPRYSGQLKTACMTQSCYITYHNRHVSCM